MNKLNRTLAVSVASAVSALAAAPASAVGFGRVAQAAVLGSPLDFTVPVHVEPDERFDADCTRVEVWFGDGKLMPGVVRTDVTRNGDSEWRVHVTTTVPVTEPVVEVGLTAGCDRAFTRRYTAFADPPLNLARVGATASAQGLAGPASLAVPGTSLGPATSLAAASDRAASRHPARVAKGPTRAAAAAAAMDRGTHHASAAAPAPTQVAGRGPRKVEPVSRLTLDGGVAHLRLDMDDPVMPPAGAASATAVALADIDADPDAKRLQSLEQNLAAIRKESQASHDETAALSARLQTAQSRADWLPWLMGALGLSLIGIGALGWRLRRATRPRSAKPWFQESAMPTAAPGLGAAAASVRVAAPAGKSADEALREDAKGDGASTPPALGVDQIVGTESSAPMAYVEDLSATQPLSRAALAVALASQDVSAPPRELSVEELLDLEQQADFFIALGQEDAAVDLLMSHLRSAGGQSPLPYTKLLEIYRRQGDRAAYERMRARFNRRFNAYAPDWDVGPGAGRTLEDYPDSVARIQAVWHSPLDAMAILEALLFKRDDTSELFDLPAYRDVLVLYSLARDLWQQSGEANGTLVDVLLPLDDFDPDAPSLPPEVPPGGSSGSSSELAGDDLHAASSESPASAEGGDTQLHGLEGTGLMPSREPAREPSYELSGFELLSEHADAGGVQATLDAAHLPPQRSAHRPDASNDEAAPAVGSPGAAREPSSKR